MKGVASETKRQADLEYLKRVVQMIEYNIQVALAKQKKMMGGHDDFLKAYNHDNVNADNVKAYCVDVRNNRPATVGAVKEAHDVNENQKCSDVEMELIDTPVNLHETGVLDAQFNPAISVDVSCEINDVQDDQQRCDVVSITVCGKSS